MSVPANCSECGRRARTGVIKDGKVICTPCAEGKARKITSEEADQIIMTREPRGLFWLDGNVNGKPCFVGIDNTDGNAWTDDFTNRFKLFDWLYGKEKEA